MTHHQPDPAPGAEPERGFLVAVLAQGVDEQDELAEMRELLRTAGVEPVGELLQRRPAPDPRTYVGKGKLVELKQAVAGSDAESLVVDDDLDPGQQRRLEDELKLRVVDRTQLILDIFAQHATSAEGKLQVELAQLEYRTSPVRRGMWQHLERLGGGIGTRGPGESQLETDRRLHGGASASSQAPAQGARAPTRHAAQGTAPRGDPGRCARRVHEHGQVHASQRAHGRLGVRRRQAVRDPGTRPRAASRTRAADTS